MRPLPTQMPAVGITAARPASQADALLDLQLPLPIPEPMDVLVQVEAISVNPADYRVRLRKPDDGETTILGWDAAGTVVACGRDADRYFQVGDAIYYAGDVGRAGCNSAYQRVDARLAARRPARWHASQAAALPLTGLTAWEALVESMGLVPEVPAYGQTLLIVGGAGGVGSIAIQLARLVPGLQVVATASRPETQAWCRQMGAQLVMDHTRPLQAQLQAAGVGAVDRVLLLNQPDAHFPALAELIAPFGHLVNIVPFKQPPDLNLLMRKSVHFSWTYMFTRSSFQTVDMARQGEILARYTALADAGLIRSTEREHLGEINAHNLGMAHARLERGDAIGKLTLAGFSNLEE